MKSKTDFKNPTRVVISIEAEKKDLKHAKDEALAKLSLNVKIPGFREGRAPYTLAEKYLDTSQLAQEALEHAINDLYAESVNNQSLKPVANPEIKVTAFVPFEELRFEAEVEVVGKIALPNYSRLLKKPKTSTKVSDKDVNEVIERLRVQFSKKSRVDRAPKSGDEVIIDFDGVHADSQEPISGASGKDYPLLIGSNSFIPGFEDQLIGKKLGKEIKVKVTFPRNYNVSSLREKPAEFKVVIKQVNSLKKPTLNDQFAKSVGSFKTLAELRLDIIKEVKAARENENSTNYQNDLVETLAKETKVDVPEVLILEEAKRYESELRQNAAYSGQTWSEYLQSEGINEKEFSDLAKERATIRIKTGLALGEVARLESIRTTQEELDLRINTLKNRYQSDKSMQQELDKPANRQDLANRILVEKTVKRLEELNNN